MNNIQELGDAATENADVEIIDGRVVWKGGTWLGQSRTENNVNF